MDKPKSRARAEEQPMRSTRDGFGDAVVEAGKNKEVVVLTADLAESTRVLKFKDAYPERFFDVGVAEQNMITVAAGLASSGKIPFACGFAVFVAGRSYDQVRLHAGVSHLNMKIVGSHAGLLTGEDGATHQGLEDIGQMRAIPGMTVISPADYFEAKKATLYAARMKGPVYLRLGRDKLPIIYTDRYNFRLGKGMVVRPGKDITIIATGPMVHEAIKAHELLKFHHVVARVINIHTIKPIDRDIIIKAAKETKAVITAEDHSIYCGLGSAVAEVLGESCPTRMMRIGVHDRFGESGKPSELYRRYGLTAEHIVKAALKMLGIPAEPR
jgi:transketolase